MEIQKGPRPGITCMAVAAVLLALSCGGKQSMASKSAAAYREAVAKGVPVGSGGHGGHTSKSEVTATAESGHDAMAGMDHSQMSGMSPSQMEHGSTNTIADMPGMSGMNQSQMKHGSSQSMANMAGMKPGSMSAMDHSKMEHGSAKSMANMPGMQHGSSQPMTNMPGMQHGSMSGMSNMAGMQHGAVSVAPVAPAPTNSSGIGRLDPASTLKTDAFDQPSPLSVSEANKASAESGHTMQMEHTPSSPPAKPPGDTKE